MPLVVEHTVYSIVNVLRPAVQTNQNNFAQLLCNQFSCYVHCNLPTPISSHSITTVICTSHTRINSITCTTIVFTFKYFLCDNTLYASCTRIATHQFFDPASPGFLTVSAASPAIIRILFRHFGQSLFICSNSPHAKHLILLASHYYNCCYGYRSPCILASLSAASTIFPRFYRHIARATCTTWSACTTNTFFSRTYELVWLLA